MMAYEKKISRAEPGLLLNILDDSGSKQENLPGTSDPKYMWVERLFGNELQELLARSTDLKGQTAVIKPRYYTYQILYGSEPHIWGNGEMDIEATVKKYTQDGNSLGLGGKLYGTDTAGAFHEALIYLEHAVTQELFKKSFPPMVFHLTDGKSATDATSFAEKIMCLSTEDGNVLIANVYIGTQTNLSYKGPDDFPGYVDISEVGQNQDNIRLFNMSSEIPACIGENLVDDGIFPNLREGARLFFDVRTKEMLKHAIQVVGSLGSRADRTQK